MLEHALSLGDNEIAFVPGTNVPVHETFEAKARIAIDEEIGVLVEVFVGPPFFGEELRVVGPVAVEGLAAVELGIVVADRKVIGVTLLWVFEPVVKVAEQVGLAIKDIVLVISIHDVGPVWSPCVVSASVLDHLRCSLSDHCDSYFTSFDQNKLNYQTKDEERKEGRTNQLGVDRESRQETQQDESLSQGRETFRWLSCR